MHKPKQFRGAHLVWVANFLQQNIKLELVRKLLSDEELIRATTIKRTQRRQEFLVGRLLARVMLALYSKCFPRRIVIFCEESGRPRVLEPMGFHFNLSHAGELAKRIKRSAIETNIIDKETNDHLIE